MEYYLETPVKIALGECCLHALYSKHHVLLLSLKISAGPPIYCLSDIFGMEWMECQKVEWIGVRKITRNSEGQHLLGRCLDDIRGIV